MIELKDGYKNYGAIRSVEGVSLRVEDGKSLCLLGRSGCGKSTVLKLIALITRLDSGRLVMSGNEVSGMTDAEMDRFREENIAYSFQEPLLIPYITALENLTVIVGTSKRRAAEMLTSLGLGDRLNHKPPKLSGGEKKRVDVARAVLKGSPILVADEPLSSVDPENGAKVMELLKAHADNGGIVIYSSVDPSQAKFADHVVSLAQKHDAQL